MPAGPAPSAEVAAAFGGDAAGLIRLTGGQGGAWRAGPIVLKQDGDEQTVAWRAEFLASIDPGEFRVAPNVRSAGGPFVVERWSATPWLDGDRAGDRWGDVLATSAAFHAAAARSPVEWPAFLAEANDPWAVAIRVAANEVPPPTGTLPSVMNLLDRTAPLRTEVTAAPAQIIHGDLAGNLLFADGLPPAVIDFSPSFAPAAFADAIVVCDAVAWWDAPLTVVVGYLARTPGGDTYGARAVAFRAVVAGILWADHPDRVDAEVARFAPILPLLQQG